MIGVERNRSDGCGDGLVEIHELLDGSGFEIERSDGADGVDSLSGGMPRQFDAVGLAGAAYMCDDAHAACGGLDPRFEDAFALGDGHRGAFARRTADEHAVGTVCDEFVGIGPDLREVDCAVFVERCEYGRDKSGEFDHGMGVHKFF